MYNIVYYIPFISITYCMNYSKIITINPNFRKKSPSKRQQTETFFLNVVHRMRHILNILTKTEIIQVEKRDAFIAG